MAFLLFCFSEGNLLSFQTPIKKFTLFIVGANSFKLKNPIVAAKDNGQNQRKPARERQYHQQRETA